MQLSMSEPNLGLMSALGVEQVVASGPAVNEDGIWALEDLAQIKSRVESAGLQLAGMNNIIGNPGIKTVGWQGRPGRHGQPQGHGQDKILLGQEGRDEQIDRICQSIRNVGKVGISFINYGFTLTGVWRTDRHHRGRGGAHMTAFDYGLVEDAPLTEAGKVDAEEVWDRCAYFLRRAIPVAEEAGVNMACHPHDPPVPELAGIPRILGSIEGYKRLVATVPSDRHGLNFCQGTVAEMGTDVVEAIRYFGSRKKIFNVHFRNIRGTADSFAETFIDNGQVDMLAALRAYKEVGYEGPLVPDHFPQIPGDENHWASWSYALGYMKALIRAVEDEG